MLFLRALASFLICPAVVAGLIPAFVIRHQAVYREWLPVSVVVLSIGVIALLWCVRDFYVSGRGTLAPWDPPVRLVVVGLYRFTRNPMYVAVLTTLVGWSALYKSTSLGVYTLTVAVILHLRVVFYEEPWLKQRFGSDWERYSARVSRWVPTRRAYDGRPDSTR